MRHALSAAVFLLVCPIALAQHFHHASAPPAPGDELRNSPCTKILVDAVPQPDVLKVYWPVTGSHAAMLYFSQGMTEYYGFNYEEALRNFRRAKGADPNMAMASWGIALAAGPNINLGMDNRCRDLAVSEMACAVDLAKKQKGVITPVEEGLINALALRYAGPITETVAYTVAMRNVWEMAKNAARTKESAATMANVGALYAESMLEMRPWALYDAAYRQALDTQTIIDVLKESMAVALAKDTEAIGANHFWIHTVEASDDFNRALPSAELLDKAVPGSGHLLHMPSHIYLLRGEYAKAMASNTEAVRVDRSQYKDSCSGWYSQYTDNLSCPQLYYGHYLSHNLFFRSVSASFSGQSAEAVTSACETREHAIHFQANEPGLQRYMTAPLMTLVLNRNWDAILNQEKTPPSNCYMKPFLPNGCHILTATWRWARGMAYAAKGNIAGAVNEYDAMATEMLDIAHPTPTGWGNNSAAAVLAIAQSTLQARYTWAGGQCKPCEPCGDKCKASAPCNASRCGGGPCQQDIIDQTIEHLKLAVTHEDALVYDEPPQWLPPAREALGGVYLRAARLIPDSGKRKEMFMKAEKTFDQEIVRHRESGRALYGRIRALIGREASSGELADARERFCKAWKDADYTMTELDLWPALDGGDGGVSTITCPKETQIVAPSSRSCPPLPPPPQ